MFTLLPFLAAAASVAVALASVIRRKPSPATWCFFAGMIVLAVDCVFTGVTLRLDDPSQIERWLTIGLLLESILPAVWLGFSLTYSRGDYRESIRRWRLPLMAVSVIPVALVLLSWGSLFQVVQDETTRVVRLQTGPVVKWLNVTLLISLMLILMNIEQTFRSAVGTMRWRIKFVVLGLIVIFGARIYVRTQSLLFASPDLPLWSVESGGVLIGCVFLGVAYARTGLAEIDVYPSLAVLRSSLAVLLVGSYLFIVGVLAQLVRRFGGAESLQLQSFVVLAGMSGLALLLLSDRARQRLHVVVGRHFKKAQHDSVRVWSSFSQRLANVRDQADLAEVSAKLLSETFDVLSVTVWLVDHTHSRLRIAAGTVPSDQRPADPTPSSDVATALRDRFAPFDLDGIHESWATEFQQLNPATFLNGGHRWAVPLRAGAQQLGVLVLADRVSGAPYTSEEIELLKCIADQTTSVLLNLRLANEVANARELEALHTMSAFFVHDLKNSAASLNLMLKNLPVHFDDPAFRADALRSIGNTARRIDDMILRLGAFRQRQRVSMVPLDLNQLIRETVDQMAPSTDIDVSVDLQPIPRVRGDREQLRSVLGNLVTNAREAVDAHGHIHVRTEHGPDHVTIAVTDNGCGMSADFVQERLFRPFQSTKKKGLGIGLYQCRSILQAHAGSIRVDSEPGRGTTFTVTLPADAQ